MDMWPVEQMAQAACSYYGWKYQPGNSYVYNGRFFVGAYYAGRVVEDFLYLDRKGARPVTLQITELLNKYRSG